MPARMSVDERVAFSGCLNARDLGGHLTALGVRIPAQRLFRADVVGAGPPGRTRPPTPTGLRTIVDLRSPAEVRVGPPVCPGPIVHHLPLDNPQRGMGTTDWQHPDTVAQRYLELLLDGEESIAELLAVLTDPVVYPVAIQCSGGKDRTGIVVAIVLALLGVDDRDIQADYALSGFGAARLVIALERHYGAQPDAVRRCVPALLSTDPANIGGFLDRLRVKFGSIDGYVTEIGMDAATRYLRSALLG